MERYKHSTDDLRPASPEELELIQAYDDIGQQIRELQTQHKLIRNQMLDKVGFDRGVESENGQRAIVSRGIHGLQLRISKPSKAVSS